MLQLRRFTGEATAQRSAARTVEEGEKLEDLLYALAEKDLNDKLEQYSRCHSGAMRIIQVNKEIYPKDFLHGSPQTYTMRLDVMVEINCVHRDQAGT